MKRIIVSTALSFAMGSIALACGGSSDSKEGSGNGSDAGSNGGSTGNGGSTSAGGSTGNGGGSNGGSTGNGGSSSGGAAGGDCDMGPCTGLVILGQSLTPCCVDNTTCGIQTPPQFGGGCTPKSTIDQLLGDGGGNLQFPDAGFNETIVLDSTCPDLPLPEAGVGGGFFDAGPSGALKGCCDKTNVCGYAFSVDFGSLSISQCFTAADAQNLGQGQFTFDAGTPKACTYPTN